MPLQYDVFISHSSHDKNEVARPLAHALQKNGLKVWLDEEQLQVGDSIRRGIDTALRESRYGVIILSPEYLASEWGQKELDTFFVKEKYHAKSILPIYHRLSVEQVEQNWPTLADKISLNTQDSNEVLADKIQLSIQGSPDVPVKIFDHKPRFWGASNNWQWFIGIIVGLAAVVIPLWYSSAPASSQTGSINIKGDVSGGTVVGVMNTNVGVDTEAAKLIAQALLNNSNQLMLESLKKQEEEVRRLTATVTRLRQQPNDELKQSALRKLRSNEPEAAALLLKESLAKRQKAVKAEAKSISLDWIDLGNIALLNDSQEALTAYSNAVEADPDNFRAWHLMGNVYERLGEIEQALRIYEIMLEGAANTATKSVAYDNLGDIYLGQDNLNKAEEYYQKSFKINEREKQKHGISRGYSNFANIFIAHGQLDKALEFQSKALAGFEDLKYEPGIALSYSNLGIIYDTLGDLDKAESFHYKALEISKSLGFKLGVAVGYGNLGYIKFTRGEFQKSADFHLKALKINETLGYKAGIADENTNLGRTYSKLGKTDKAEGYLLRALKIDESLGRKRGVGAKYGNLGLLSSMRGDFKKAEEFHLKSLEINESIRNQDGIAGNYTNLGSLYFEHGDLDKAESLLLKSMSLFEALGQKVSVGNAFINLGLIDLAREDYRKACAKFTSSLNVMTIIDAGLAKQSSDIFDMYCSPDSKKYFQCSALNRTRHF